MFTEDELNEKLNEGAFTTSDNYFIKKKDKGKRKSLIPFETAREIFKCEHPWAILIEEIAAQQNLTMTEVVLGIADVL